MSDIEIEEHDLLQNPVLKKIFPDLSVLKKEIIDYMEEINDEKSNTRECEIYENSLNTMSDNENNSNKEGTFYSGLDIQRNTKVILQDVGPILTKSRKFCEICLILFPDKKSLNDHQSLFHSTKNVCQINPVNSNNNVNVMVKINDHENSNMESSSLRSCFHCDLLFPVGKSLIEHLYEVLNAQKAKNTDIKNQANKIAQKDKTTSCSAVQKKNEFNHINPLFCCPVCSYYFDVKKDYMKHLLIKHNINKTKSISYVKFNPNCKFCILKYSNVLSYNEHLCEIHYDKIIKKYPYQNNLKCANENCTKRKTDEHANINSFELSIPMKELRVMFLKIVLFQCNECQIHFLTLEAATNHAEHSGLASNWQCTNCWRNFKQKDAIIHEKQHLYTNYFTITKVFNERQSEKLYTKENFLNYCNVCETKQDNSSSSKETMSSINHQLVDLDEIISKEPRNEKNTFEQNMDIDHNVEEDINCDQNLISQYAIRSDGEVLVTYTCKNCDVSMNVYNQVVEHCHLHNNLNDLRLETSQCVTCKLKFIATTFEEHQNLHIAHTNDQFKHFKFDVLNFDCNNDEWLKYLYGTLSSNCISKFIKSSVYKYDNRIKMKITQQGVADLTLYKCDKCQCIIDSYCMYEHITNCCTNSDRFFCKDCNLPFLNNVSKMEHETIHCNSNISAKSFRIVTFNQEQDRITNLANMKKYYVFYQCRSCHVVVDKNLYKNHECGCVDFKLCCDCGLLIHKSDYNKHTTKHKRVSSFNKNFMNVVLIGSNENDISSNRNNILPIFNGMISDYTFYQCVKCEVCVRDKRNTLQHFCLINAAKSKCPRCGLKLDEGKLKGHIKLHDADPDFTKDTLMIKKFGFERLNNVKNSLAFNANVKERDCDLNNDELNINYVESASAKNKVNGNRTSLEPVNIYKCSCGLHFFNEATIKTHKKKCSDKIKIKQSKQNCFKCGLAFSHNILFQHLLKHHKGKNAVFKYEIIKIK